MPLIIAFPIPWLVVIVLGGGNVSVCPFTTTSVLPPDVSRAIVVAAVPDPMTIVDPTARVWPPMMYTELPPASVVAEYVEVPITTGGGIVEVTSVPPCGEPAGLAELLLPPFP